MPFPKTRLVAWLRKAFHPPSVYITEKGYAKYYNDPNL